MPNMPIQLCKIPGPASLVFGALCEKINKRGYRVNVR